MKFRPQNLGFGGQTIVITYVYPQNGRFGGQTHVIDIVHPQIELFGGQEVKAREEVMVTESMPYKKTSIELLLLRFSVVPPGIEPGTQGFSVLCSTN